MSANQYIKQALVTRSTRLKILKLWQSKDIMNFPMRLPPFWVAMFRAHIPKGFPRMPSLSLVHAMTYAAAASAFIVVSAIAPSLAGTFQEGAKSEATAGTFSATGLMTSPRSLHTANLLTDGRVLLAGGVGAGGSSSSTLDSAELYDPITRTFGATSAMSTPRLGAASVRLNDGRVFMAGEKTPRRPPSRRWNSTTRSPGPGH